MHFMAANTRNCAPHRCDVEDSPWSCRTACAMRTEDVFTLRTIVGARMNHDNGSGYLNCFEASSAFRRTMAAALLCLSVACGCPEGTTAVGGACKSASSGMQSGGQGSSPNAQSGDPGVAGSQPKAAAGGSGNTGPVATKTAGGAGNTSLASAGRSANAGTGSPSAPISAGSAATSTQSPSMAGSGASGSADWHTDVPAAGASAGQDGSSQGVPSGMNGNAPGAGTGASAPMAPLGVCAMNANQTICEGEVMHHCSADGQSTAPETCMSPTLCQLGVPSSACAVCNPGTFKCTGAKLEKCNDAGQYEFGATCATAALCKEESGQCTEMVCQPGKKTCAPDGTIQTCNTDGSAQSPGDRCGQDLCDARNGTCYKCKPGSVTCSGKNAVTCSSDGSTTTPKTCESQNDCVVASCSDGVGCMSGSYQPAKTRCTSSGGAQCDGTGHCVECMDSSVCGQKKCGPKHTCVQCTAASDCGGQGADPCRVAPTCGADGACAAGEMKPSGTSCMAPGDSQAPAQCGASGTCVIPTIAIRSEADAVSGSAHGMYVTADNPNSELHANSSSVTSGAKFALVHNADGTFSLYSLSRKQYVSAVVDADSAGTNPLRATSPVLSDWEKFDIVSSGSYVRLRARVNSLYVSAVNADQGTSNLLRAYTPDTPDRLGDWEQFSLHTCNTEAASVLGSLPASNGC